MDELMNLETAIGAAQHWVMIRKDVRRVLIAAAREQNPFTGDALRATARSNRVGNDVRKLHQYPSDLSEARLLALLGRLDLPRLERR